MRIFVSLAAAAAVAFGLSVGATTAQAVTNDFFLTDDSPVQGNTCEGGGFEDCSYDGAFGNTLAIIKFEFEDDGTTVSGWEIATFDSIDGSEFTFEICDTCGDFGYKWTYTPDADDPGVTAFQVKGGNYFNIYEKASAAFVGVGDFSDNWQVPFGAGLSHIVFFDTLTPIPLPAGLLLFLSGLAGVGYLGRYKAKRQHVAA